MNKCFSWSGDPSPINYGNLIVGSCPGILNCDEILPLCNIDILMLLLGMAPPVDAS
jgi:hypothetical protein